RRDTAPLQNSAGARRAIGASHREVKLTVSLPMQISSAIPARQTDGLTLLRELFNSAASEFTAELKYQPDRLRRAMRQTAIDQHKSVDRARTGRHGRGDLRAERHAEKTQPATMERLAPGKGKARLITTDR
ncbi:hypothetical protein, partial [Pseudomonas nitroreducens]|uniref:hypothetical protein n=1 Tax=Pseudomonas nitroreducens TaxID=46680 RepID=UPI001A8D0AB8